MNSSDRNLMCETIGQIESVHDFFACYRYFIRKEPTIFTLKITLALATVIINTCVFTLITRSKNTKSVFDLIFCAHTIPDFFIGLTQVTSYSTYTTFKYWPLGKIACLVYCSLDYALPHISILHTLYLAYARLRSLLSPLSYQNEILIKHVNKVVLCIWFLSVLLWIVPINTIMSKTFENNGICNFTYEWQFVLLFGLIVNIIPICLIALFTFIILIIICKNMKRKRKLKKKQTKKTEHPCKSAGLSAKTITSKTSSTLMAPSNMNATVKLLIMLFTFLLNWIPFCILWIIDSSCACVNPTLYTVAFWLTYFQSLMNPTWILILNYRKYK
jgi:hypothetical protein